jgi:alpha-amylase
VAPAVATLRAGESLRLTATAASDDRSEVRIVAVSWLSSDESIATVSSAGQVRGVRPGLAEIQVRWGTSVATARITVLKATPEVACLSIIPKEAAC